MLVKAIHTIQRSRKVNPSTVKPGELVELTGDELDYVLKAGAAVKATKTEAALHDTKPTKGKKVPAKEAPQKQEAPQQDDDDDIDLGEGAKGE